MVSAVALLDMCLSMVSAIWFATLRGFTLMAIVSVQMVKSLQPPVIALSIIKTLEEEAAMQTAQMELL